MVEIREVKTKKEQKEFVDFPLKLYKGNPYFVPPLYGDEMKLFGSKNIYCDQAESVFYNAYKDGKMVGRIHGILQKAANQKWNQKQVRFTRFDSVDDREVSDALFNKLAAWAKERGMDELVGPLGFSDLDREGLLIEGFDQLSTFEEQYNYDYYQKLIEDYGFEKDVDWVERKLSAPEKIDERIPKIADMMMKKYKLHKGYAKNTNDFIKKYADSFFEILDETYTDLYQTVPFTPAMKKMMIDNFKLIVDVKYVAVILDENDKVVCFGLCFPSIAKAVQKSGGKLTPAAIIRLLKALKKPEVIDLALIGVLPEYARKGISSTLIWGVMEMLTNGTVKYAETNLNLEDNIAIQNQWKIFDNVLHKRRRAFKKKI
ncbi:MAG: N-acetyltransferase [Clostridia bacterium]|nr:N-acetyltransferase [Clostridia bacterium]